MVARIVNAPPATRAKRTRPLDFPGTDSLRQSDRGLTGMSTSFPSIVSAAGLRLFSSFRRTLRRPLSLPSARPNENAAHRSNRSRATHLVRGKPFVVHGKLFKQFTRKAWPDHDDRQRREASHLMQIFARSCVVRRDLRTSTALSMVDEIANIQHCTLAAIESATSRAPGEAATYSTSSWKGNLCRPGALAAATRGH